MNSQSWFERAQKMIPGGVSSPVRAFRHVGGTPVYFEKASGPYLYDVEGKRYIDFCLSFGPHLLGHLPPTVVSALEEQIHKATAFGACHPGEVELSEAILHAYPFLEKVRLVNSGTEAVMTAVRVARGATGRAKVLKFEGCYHGHSDGFLAKAGSGVAELSEASSKGVPSAIVETTLVGRLDDEKGIEAIFNRYGNEIAAVIMELIPANDGLMVPERDFWKRIFDLARKHGSLVIADEVITGFRLGPNGASGYFDLRPDLVTLGKIVGGGLPLAAVVGRKDLMDTLAPMGPVYQAGTLSGNPMATAAGLAVLRELRANPPYDRLSARTKQFVEELSKLLPLAETKSVSSLFWIHFGKEDGTFPPIITDTAKQQYAKFFWECLKGGVYLPPSAYEVGFLSTAHNESVLRDALEVVKGACSRL